MAQSKWDASSCLYREWRGDLFYRRVLVLRGGDAQEIAHEIISRYYIHVPQTRYCGQGVDYQGIMDFRGFPGYGF
jgi:hypothetical protein